MSIDTIRTRPVRDRSPTPDRRVIEVSEVDAREVTDYAASVDAAHPEVYLERKGGRTYLVAD